MNSIVIWGDDINLMKYDFNSFMSKYVNIYANKTLLKINFFN